MFASVGGGPGGSGGNWASAGAPQASKSNINDLHMI
jgi:hypothetical protein